MRGLAFDSLPAHVVGSGTDSTGRTVDLQRLGNTLAGRDEDVIVENGGIRPADARPAGYAGPWVEMAPTAVQGPATVDTDPFTMLDQLRDVGLKQVTPLFDSQEQMLKAQIDKTKGDLYRQYLVEAEGLNGLGLDAEQLGKKQQQLKTKYKMAFTKATIEIEPQMQALAMERQKAVARVDAEHAERRLRIQQVQAMADRGLVDAAAAKQEQFGILGYSIPLSTIQPSTPIEQMRELEYVAKSVEDTALRFKEEKGGAYEDVGTGSESEWKKVTDPQRISELRAAKDLYDQAVSAKRQLAAQHGRKLGLVDVARSAASPIAAAVKTYRPTSPKMWAMGANGWTDEPVPAASGVREMSDDELKRIAGVR